LYADGPAKKRRSTSSIKGIHSQMAPVGGAKKLTPSSNKEDGRGRYLAVDWKIGPPEGQVFGGGGGGSEVIQIGQILDRTH